MTNIYADGSGWNGKEWKYCIVVDVEGMKPIIITTKGLYMTNNAAEYYAVLEAMKLAESGDNILTDSKLIIGQVLSGWKCNFEHLRKLRDEVRNLMSEKDLTLNWVSRNDNKAGKVLERE